MKLLFGLLLCLAAPAWADIAATDIPVRFERVRVDYRLNADSSHVETHERVTTVLKERAVERVKHTSITYSTSIQKAEILEAYTRKADGRRLEVPKDNYQLEVNSGRNKDAPVFSDYTTLALVFPEVAVGDTVVLRYKITQTEPIFPGHFSESATFPRTYAFDDVAIRFDLPAALWVQYQARGMTEKIVEQEGRKIIEWTWQNKQPIKSERRDYSVYDGQQEPGYALSTFRTYAEIAEAYGARARAKAAVTPQVQKLADELTAGLTTPRDQARALYDWVATHITYAGNCIGVGAVVPHDIPFILDNRMGDCKDHATLLQALLAAKGIASTQALVNAGSAYRLPPIPLVSSVNHVINFIPSLDLYVDSTAETIPFGLLPFQAADKPVLWVDGYRETTRTPAQPIGENRQQVKTVVKIAPDGSASGHMQVELKGQYAAGARTWVRRLSEDDKGDLIKHWYQKQGWIGSGTADLPEAKELRDTYNYSTKFERQSFVQRPGAGAFTIEPFFYTDAPVIRFAGQAVAPVEEVEVACSSGYSSEEYLYEFPKGMTILSVPDNLTVGNEILSYRASYKLKGNKLTVKRVLDDRTQGNVCSPATVKAYRELAKKILPNVRAQVLFK